MTKDQCHDCK